MSIEESPRLRRAIQTQRGRKPRKIGGTLQRGWTSHRIGPPPPGPPSRGGGKTAQRSGRERALTTPTLSVQVRRNCRWHSECQNGTPRRSGVGSFLVLRNQAIRHFRSVPKWHQDHDPKVATLCQIAAFFHDDVTSPSRAAGQPGPRAENRERGARSRGGIPPSRT